MGITFLDEEEKRRGITFLDEEPPKSAVTFLDEDPVQSPPAQALPAQPAPERIDIHQNAPEVTAPPQSTLEELRPELKDRPAIGKARPRELYRPANTEGQPLWKQFVAGITDRVKGEGVADLLPFGGVLSIVRERGLKAAGETQALPDAERGAFYQKEADQRLEDYWGQRGVGDPVRYFNAPREALVDSLAKEYDWQHRKLLKDNQDRERRLATMTQAERVGSGLVDFVRQLAEYGIARGITSRFGAGKKIMDATLKGKTPAGIVLGLSKAQALAGAAEGAGAFGLAEVLRKADQVLSGKGVTWDDAVDVIGGAALGAMFGGGVHAPIKYQVTAVPAVSFGLAKLEGADTIGAGVEAAVNTAFVLLGGKQIRTENKRQGYELLRRSLVQKAQGANWTPHQIEQLDQRLQDWLMTETRTKTYADALTKIDRAKNVTYDKIKSLAQYIEGTPAVEMREAARALPPQAGSTAGAPVAPTSPGVSPTPTGVPPPLPQGLPAAGSAEAMMQARLAPQISAATEVVGTKGTRFPATYVWLPRAEVQASHDAATFNPNPNYSLTNTRDYSSQAEREKVIRAANEWDPTQHVTDSTSAAVGPAMVARVTDEQGVARYLVLGGNTREMALRRARPEALEREAQLEATRAERFGLPAPVEPGQGIYRMLGEFDLRQAGQREKLQSVIDALNPAPGKVQNVSEMARVDASTNLPIKELAALNMHVRPEEAQAFLAGQISAGTLDANLRSQLAENPAQAQQYVRSALAFGAFRNQALVDFVGDPSLKMVTPRTLVENMVPVLLNMRTKGMDTLADAIAGNLQTAVNDYKTKGGNLRQALDFSAKQQALGGDGQAANELAGLLRDMTVVNKRGAVDAEKSAANYQLLIDVFKKAIASYEASPDIFGTSTSPQDMARGVVQYGRQKLVEPAAAGEDVARAAAEPGAEYGGRPWRENFPQVVIQTNVTTLKARPEYAAAKAGNSDAADDLVTALVKSDRITRIIQQYPRVIVVPVRAFEKQGYNAIPESMAAYISELWSVPTANLYQTNHTGHTGSDAITRLLSVPEFAGEVEAGQAYMIVDDVVTSGATINALRKYIESQGGQVVNVVALATTSSGQTGYGGQLSPTKSTLDKLTQKHNIEDLERLLNEYGIAETVSELTNSQALYLATFNSVDAIRARISQAIIRSSGSQIAREIPPPTQDVASARDNTTSEPPAPYMSGEGTLTELGQSLRNAADLVNRLPAGSANPQVLASRAAGQAAGKILLQLDGGLITEDEARGMWAKAERDSVRFVAKHAARGGQAEQMEMFAPTPAQGLLFERAQAYRLSPDQVLSTVVRMVREDMVDAGPAGGYNGADESQAHNYPAQITEEGRARYIGLSLTRVNANDRAIVSTFLPRAQALTISLNQADVAAINQAHERILEHNARVALEEQNYDAELYSEMYLPYVDRQGRFRPSEERAYNIKFIEELDAINPALSERLVEQAFEVPLEQTAQSVGLAEQMLIAGMPGDIRGHVELVGLDLESRIQGALDQEAAARSIAEEYIAKHDIRDPERQEAALNLVREQVNEQAKEEPEQLYLPLAATVPAGHKAPARRSAGAVVRTPSDTIKEGKARAETGLYLQDIGAFEPELRQALERQDRVSTVLWELSLNKIDVTPLVGKTVLGPKDWGALNMSLRNNVAEACKIAVSEGDEIIYAEVVSIGALNSSQLDGAMLERVIQRAQLYRKDKGKGITGLRVWLAHNHPSGNSQPSGADLSIYKLFESRLQALGVEMGDAISTDGDTFYSHNSQTVERLATYTKAPWEVVPVNQRQKLNSPELLGRLVTPLLQADPESLYIVYLDNALQLVSVERYRGTMRNMPLTSHIMTWSSVEGISAVCIAGNTQQLDHLKLDLMAKDLKKMDVKLIDVASEITPSYYTQGLLAAEPAPAAGTAWNLAEPATPYGEGTPVEPRHAVSLRIGRDNWTPLNLANLGEHVKPIELPELIKMAKALGADVGLKVFGRGTRGMFTGDPLAPRIKLDKRIFVDARVAAQVLGHEIGHLADWLDDKDLARGNVIGRIKGLHKFLKGQFGSLKNKELRDELLAITQWWTPWDPEKATAHYNAYRRSAKELYAQALSVLFNTPAELQKRAPKFWRAFFNALDARPGVKAEFFETYDKLNRPYLELTHARHDDYLKMVARGDEILLRRRAQSEEQAKSLRGWLDGFKQDYWDKNSPGIAKVRQAQATGAKIAWHQNPEWIMDAHPLASNRNYLFMEKVYNDVVQALSAEGLPQSALGEYLFYNRILNERYFVEDQAGNLVPAGRATIANPLGITPDVARKQLLSMRLGLAVGNKMSGSTRSGLESWTILEDRAQHLQDMVADVMEQAHAQGILSDKQIKMIRANKHNYAAFASLDHLEAGDNIPAGIRKQTGMLGDTMDPFSATVIKTNAMLKWIQYEQFKSGYIDFKKQYFPDELRPAEMHWDGHKMAPKDPPGGETLVMRMRAGKPEWFVVSELEGKMFESNMPSDLDAGLKVLNLSFRKIIYPLWITYNPTFGLLNNPIRDFNRSWRNLFALGMSGAGRKLAAEYARNWRSAIAYLQGKTDPLVQEALANLVLPSPQSNARLYQAANPGAFEAMLEDYGLASSPSRVGAFMERHSLLRPAKRLLGWIVNTAAVLETLPKLSAYKLLRDTLPPEVAAQKVRNFVGTPPFYRRGKNVAIHQSIIPFLNIFMRGWEADAELMFGKQTRSAWWLHWAATSGVWTVLKALGKAGLLGAWVKLVLDGQSENTLTSKHVIPVGLQAGAPGTGKKSVVITWPMSETDRLINSIVYRTLTGVLDQGDPRTAWQKLTSISGLVGGELPGLNPLIEIPVTWGQYVAGQNPLDTFRGRPILTNDEYLRGGTEGAAVMMGWTVDQLGVLNMFKYNPNTGTTLEATAVNTPFVRSLIKISDAGYRERQQAIETNLDRVNAVLRGHLAPDIQRALSEYNRLMSLRAANRTEADQERLDSLSRWYSSEYRPAWDEMQDLLEYEPYTSPRFRVIARSILPP